MIAHRGAWGAAAENTLAAFERAIAVGAEMIELDVRRTRDGRLIVLHDGRVGARRTSRIHHHELTAKGSNERPPLLQEVLDLVGSRLALDVEVKEPGYVETVIDLLYGFGIERCLLTSFLPVVVREAKVRAPALRTGLLIAARPRGRLAARLDRVGADVVGLHRRIADEETIARTASAGRPCLVWTVNDERELDHYLDHPSIAGVITDRPEQALERRARLSVRTALAGPS